MKVQADHVAGLTPAEEIKRWDDTARLICFDARLKANRGPAMNLMFEGTLGVGLCAFRDEAELVCWKWQCRYQD